jgi:hypothetical protein
VRAAFVGISAIGTKHGVGVGATFGAAHSGPTNVDPDAVRHAADQEVRRARRVGSAGSRSPGRDLIELSR